MHQARHLPPAAGWEHMCVSKQAASSMQPGLQRPAAPSRAGARRRRAPSSEPGWSTATPCPKLRAGLEHGSAVPQAHSQAGARRRRAPSGRAQRTADLPWSGIAVWSPLTSTIVLAGLTWPSTCTAVGRPAPSTQSSRSFQQTRRPAGSFRWQRHHTASPAAACTPAAPRHVGSAPAATAGRPPRRAPC